MKKKTRDRLLNKVLTRIEFNNDVKKAHELARIGYGLMSPSYRDLKRKETEKKIDELK